MGKSDNEFEDAIKNKSKIYVLFYASWCPFSQRFLPIFAKYAESTQDCLRIEIEDKEALCEKYSVDTVPTVLLFQRGSVAKRLDGEPGAGINEAKLVGLLKS